MQLLAYCVMFLFCSQIDQRIKNFEVNALTDVLREKRSIDDGDETTAISKNEHHEEKPFHRAHSDLINSLLENYDMSASPTHVSNEPTVISVNLQLISLDDISDTKMEYIIDTRITFFWMDGRLMSPECRDENIDCDDQFDLKKHLPDLWTPDLYILNSRFAKLHDQPFENSMLYLLATGKVILSKRLTLTLRCPMDLVLYPLDTQRCPLLICPYSLPEEELIMKWAEKSVSILNTDKGGKNKFDLEKPIRTGHMKLKYDGPDGALSDAMRLFHRY